MLLLMKGLIPRTRIHHKSWTHVPFPEIDNNNHWDCGQRDNEPECKVLPDLENAENESEYIVSLKPLFPLNQRNVSNTQWQLLT